MNKFLPFTDTWPFLPTNRERFGLLVLVGLLISVTGGLFLYRYTRHHSLHKVTVDETRPDINKDPWTRLEEIPEIGPKRARAIVRHRTENGKFESIDELTEVQGIGPRIVSKIRTHVQPLNER